MTKRLGAFVFCLFFFSNVIGEIIPLTSTDFRTRSSTPFTFELANTPNQRAWGLMGRKELKENHGMIFSYPSSNIISLWSFNCYISLSVAFLDEERIIREVQDLHAHPEKMDPERPVYTLEDLSQYPSYDPILRYFQNESIRSTFPAKYAMEMDLNWFSENEIKKGDVVNWKPNSGNGEIVHTWDLSHLEPSSEKMYLIKLLRPESVAISIPQSQFPMDVVFFDSDDTMLSKATLAPGITQSKKEKTVYFVDGKVKRVIVLPGGWIDKNSIEQLNTVLEIALVEKFKS